MENDNEVIKIGLETWGRVRASGHWEDWTKIGAAFVIGRKEAMLASHTNTPSGARYNIMFGAWLDRHPAFTEIDRSIRKYLFDCMDDLAAINEWRETLPLKKKLAINNPATVWRNWQASQRPKNEEKPKKESAKAELARLQAELTKALARLDQVEGGSHFDLDNDRPADIAQVMVGRSLSRAKALRDHLNKRIRAEEERLRGKEPRAREDHEEHASF